jgi:hypothetical protein
MNHCYIIKIWNCVHMNKVKKLNDFYFKFFPPVYYVLYILLSHDDGDWLQQQGRVSLLYCVCVCVFGVYYILSGCQWCPRPTPPIHYIIIIYYIIIVVVVVVSVLSFLVVLRIIEPAMRFSCKNHTKRTDRGVVRGWCSLPSYITIITIIILYYIGRGHSIIYTHTHTHTHTCMHFGCCR